MNPANQTHVKERVTMADLAASLGLAESTVSRALRGDRRISAATRNRVLTTAEAMGYRPNAMVSALMSVRRRHGNAKEIDTIALVTDYQGEGGWRSKDVCRWEYEGICKRANQLGYRIEEFPLANFAHDATRLEKALQTRGIRGVLLGFSRERRKHLPIDIARFTVVGLSAYFNEVIVDRANFHGFYNVRLAFDEMRRLGYQRVGLVVPAFNNQISGHQWSSSALDWQWHQEEDRRCLPLIAEETQPEVEFLAWLERENPEAILVYKLPVQIWLARCRKSLPVAFLYRTQSETRSAPGIDGNLALVGAAAIDLVVEALHTNRTGVPEHPKEVLIKGTWSSSPRHSEPTKHDPCVTSVR